MRKLFENLLGIFAFVLQLPMYGAFIYGLWAVILHFGVVKYHMGTFAMIVSIVLFPFTVIFMILEGIIWSAIWTSS